MKLTDKVAVVTGSSRGIGKAIALEFAKEGADILVNYYQSRREASEVVQEISKLGRRAIAIQADVSKQEDVRKLFAEALKQFGKVDILVNNAGIYLEFSAKEGDLENWQRMLDVNVKGTLLCAHSIAKHMLSRKSGKIINISSVSGLFGGTGYGMTKAADIAITQGLARELAPYVQVNSIAPGVIDTGWVSQLSEKEKEELRAKIPLRRWGEPEDIAKVALFLASEDSDFMTGSTVVVDGGDSITI